MFVSYCGMFHKYDSLHDMYIFAILSPWLLLGSLLSSQTQENLIHFLKGSLSGLYWFIPWMILRIILPQFFTLELSADGIFYRYLSIHMIIPFVILLLSSKLKLKKQSATFIFGKCVSFFIFSGYLNIFLFPLYGPYTAAFVIPISTGVLIISLYLSCTFFLNLNGSFLNLINFKEYVHMYRVQCIQFILYFFQMVFLFVILSYFLVLDFQRLTYQLVFWILGSFGILFSMYKSRLLIDLLNVKILIPLWDSNCKLKIIYSFQKVFGNFFKKNKE
jgi:hypothetical protein